MATLGSHACIRTKARLTLERGGKKTYPWQILELGEMGG